MFDLTRLQDLLPDEMSPAYRAQLDLLDSFYTKIEAAFNPQFVDDLWTAHIRLNIIDADETFVKALRLGAQLALALLIQFPPTSAT